MVTKQFTKNEMTQISINNNTILLNKDFQKLFMSMKLTSKLLY